MTPPTGLAFLHPLYKYTYLRIDVKQLSGGGITSSSPTGPRRLCGRFPDAALW
jgi:hypothetical protein